MQKKQFTMNISKFKPIYFCPHEIIWIS